MMIEKVYDYVVITSHLAKKKTIFVKLHISMVPDQLVYIYIVLFLQSDTQTVMFYIDGPKVEELILLQI